ncbi:unnamed protein product [Lactuca saligna]|uniref:FBD domain-containing protein n=1 Tax=Lactuca saligna TaxID=75948 RepID=A0AA36EE22_LACSI|nr:unnamed protein product [Lactuca saligna]
MICNFLKFRGESKHYFTVLYTFTPNSGFVAKFLEGKQRNFVAAMEMVVEGQNQPKIPTKRIKFEEIMEEGGEDRISALSDCFLFEILSGLPTTKDTIRTGKLSRRWKHLRESVLETLVLDRCYGFGRFRLNITSKSVKKLVLSGYHEPEYDYEGLEDILDINAPDVLSLTIKDYTNLWHWRRARREEMLKRFILNLSHVKELKIGSFCSKVLSRLKAKGFVVP